jgi:hypothetical protein
MFMLKRTDGKYVGKPGSKHSYTTRIDLARVYKTKEEAEKDRCPENEHVVEIPRLFTY